MSDIGCTASLPITAITPEPPDGPNLVHGSFASLGFIVCPGGK